MDEVPKHFYSPIEDLKLFYFMPTEMLSVDADKGIQEFTNSIYPFDKPFVKSDIVLQAQMLNKPCLVNNNTIDEQSLFKFNNTDILISSIKTAESNRGSVLRLFEAKGGSSSLIITLPHNIAKVQICDMLENPLDDIAFFNDQISLQFKPFEVKTIYME